MRKRTVIWKAVAALVATIIVGACTGTPHARSITLTFIRHAESQTTPATSSTPTFPARVSTEEGKAQAEQLAHSSRNNFDGVYASTWSVPSRPLRRWPKSSASGWKSCPACGRSTPAGTTGTTPCEADLTYLLAPADWLNGDLKNSRPRLDQRH